MIDTPSNRQFASPTEDFSTWTPTTEFASTVESWIRKLEHHKGDSTSQNHQKQPTLENGAFYVFRTNKGQTTVEKTKP